MKSPKNKIMYDFQVFASAPHLWSCWFSASTPNKTGHKFKIWNSKIITVLCNVTSCKWRTSTDTAQKPTASILRILNLFYREDSGRRLLWNVGTYLPCTRRHIPEDNNLYIQYRQNLKSVIKLSVKKMSAQAYLLPFQIHFIFQFCTSHSKQLNFTFRTGAKWHISIRLLQYSVAWLQVRRQY
jgi:hypothetical protein